MMKNVSQHKKPTTKVVGLFSFQKNPVFLCFLIIILLLSSISVVATSELIADGQYAQYLGTEGSTGTFPGINIYESIQTRVATAKGSLYPPIAIDFNYNGHKQLILTQGSTLHIINYTGGQLTTIDSKVLEGTQTGQMSAFNTSKGNIEYIVPTTAGVYQLSFNESKINVSNFINFSASTYLNQTRQGPRCVRPIVGTGSDVHCYWMDFTGNVIDYNVNTYNITNTSITETVVPSNGNFPISDVDSDLNKEIGIVLDNGGDSKHDAIIYDIASRSIKLTISNVDIGYTTSSNINSITFSDLDGGNKEIIISADSNLGVNYRTGLEIYTTDGSLYEPLFIAKQATDELSGSPAVVGNFINNGGETSSACGIGTVPRILYFGIFGILTIDLPAYYCIDYEVKTGSVEACTVWNSVAGSGVTCWSDVNGSTAAYNRGSTNGYWNINHLLAVDTDQDTYLDVITSTGVEYPNLGFTGQNNSYNLDSGGNTIVADIDGDGISEFIGSTTSDTYVLGVAGTNNPPVLTNTFKRTWENPVCVNTTIDFSVVEYDELTTPQTAGTSYYNDFDLDHERITTSCGLVASDKSSNFSLSNPTIDCHYNTTGTYNVVFYLDDSSNINDKTVIGTETVQVIDGIQGSTCNINMGLVPDNVIPDATEPLPTTSVGGGLSRVIDSITGGDTDSKLFIAMILLVGFVIAVGAKTQNGWVVSLGFLGLFIILVAIGMIPVWILVVFMLALAFIGIMINATSSAGA